MVEAVCGNNSVSKKKSEKAEVEGLQGAEAELKSKIVD